MASGGMTGAARLLAIALFAATTAAAGLFSMPPLDRDEARFAQATAQMLETGDFITIRFQDDERNKKPAGIYWMQAASVSAFSSVEARAIWAYRLPSLAGAVMAALFTYLAGARLFGPSTGFLAAMLLAAAPAVAGEATIAKTDAMLLACVAGAQTALIHVWLAALDRRRAGLATALVFWFAVGAGVLIKGPIILMVVGLTAGALFLRAPRLLFLSAMRPVSGAFILMLMIAPWAIAIDRATEGRFFAEAVGGDMLAKVGAAQESHSGPPGYYAALLLPLFWPASALIPAGIRMARNELRAPAIYALIAWIAPAWLVFELTATKLPHYALPLYPAIALLAARAATSQTGARATAWLRVGAAAYCLVGFALAAAIIALPIIYQEEPLKPYCFAVAAGLGLATPAAGALFWRGRAQSGAIAAAFIASAAAWTLLAGVLPSLDRLALSPRLSAAIDEAGLHPLRDGAAPVALAGYGEPSAIFLLGTKTILTDGRGAARLLSEKNRAVVIERRENAAFEEELRAAGIDARPVIAIEGVNYSKGKDVTLTVYRAAGNEGAQ